MKIIERNSGLYADFYEFTMSQGYFLTAQGFKNCCFDYFFRTNPFNGGYVIFAGLGDTLSMIESFKYDDDGLEFLEKLKFRKEFIHFLKDFKFKGNIYSVKEGEVVFPLEPLLRVQGTLIECQLIETLLLNIVNFESLIATKASRIREAAKDKSVMDFGLRRAQGLGGIHATKAAIIGGIDGTSNVLSAYEYNLDLAGTLAHSWIQTFDDELAAFRKFAEIYPETCVLLVDTYDTLRMGIPNAITIAKELEKSGYKLLGIRLDSGDFSYLSKHARHMLDEAGLPYVKIIVSNQLDEYVIQSLISEQNAPIDSFGVGTKLITGYDSAALDGVYKLSMFDNNPRLKFSENYSKLTLPGIKNIIRYTDDSGQLLIDGICMESEKIIEIIHHPSYPEKRFKIEHFSPENLLNPVMVNGEPLKKNSVIESSNYRKQRLASLSPEYKRFRNPHTYKVGLTDELLKLRNRFIEDHNNRIFT